MNTKLMSRWAMLSVFFALAFAGTGLISTSPPSEVYAYPFLIAGLVAASLLGLATALILTPRV